MAIKRVIEDLLRQLCGNSKGILRYALADGSFGDSTVVVCLITNRGRPRTSSKIRIIYSPSNPIANRVVPPKKMINKTCVIKPVSDFIFSVKK